MTHSVTDRHPDPKIGPQVYVGPIKNSYVITCCSPNTFDMINFLIGKMLSNKLPNTSWRESSVGHPWDLWHHVVWDWDWDWKHFTNKYSSNCLITRTESLSFSTSSQELSLSIASHWWSSVISESQFKQFGFSDHCGRYYRPPLISVDIQWT